MGVNVTGFAGILGGICMAAGKIGYMRIGLAGFFGYAGIPVTVFGFYSLYEMLEDKTAVTARLYRASLFGFAAFGGAVHIICCYLVTGIKKALETGTAAEDVFNAVLREQGGYIIPCTAVFFLFYGILVVSMAMLIFKKKTFLPQWMWIINPLLFKLLLNSFREIGSSAFINGIVCSNMSLGAMIIFGAWLAVLCRRNGSAG